MDKWLLPVALIFATPAFTQVTLPGCGYLNGPTCGITDYEFWNNGAALSCDFGLAKSNGTCVMGTTRQSLPFDQSWVVWALNSQQRYSIGADLQIDQNLTLGTHNSYSSYRQGFLNEFSTDHVYSITDQLQWGMRSIRIDPAYYNGNWRVCHGGASVCAGLATVSSDRLFVYAIMEVADWLNAHPNEFIYLMMDGDNGAVVDDWETIITHYIPISKIFTPNDLGTTWPTMRGLLQQHKQVMLFTHPQTAISGLAFSFLNQMWNIKTSDAGYATCNAYDSNNNLLSVLNRPAGIFATSGEDRTGSVAFANWGLMDEAQIVTGVQCGFSNLQLDFVDNLGNSYYNFVELRKDTRREAAVWSWAPGDYGKLGPAEMRLIDGRWTSAPSGTNLAYACAVDVDARNRTWYVASTTGPWANGETACKAVQSTSHFAFPRNGFENLKLRNAQLEAGVSDLWLNYSAQSAGSGLIINTKPVPVVQSGDAPPPLTFDVSTSVSVPSDTGVVLSFSMNIGNGIELDENTIYTQSTLRTFYLPDSWRTQKAAGTYTSSAHVELRSPSTGTTIAQTDVPFTIIVQAASTITLQPVLNPVQEGFPSTLKVNLTATDSTLINILAGTISIFELITDPTTQVTSPQTIAGPFPSLASQNVVIGLPPGSHNLAARFTPLSPYLTGSASSTAIQGVVGFINPSPNSFQFTMDAGGALPGQQSFSGQSSAQPPQVTSNVNWVNPVSTSGQGINFTTNIRPTPAAQSLSPGQYNGQIMVADGVHVSAPIAVTLAVRGRLNTSTNSVTALTSGASYSSEVDMTDGGNLPLQLQYPPGGRPSWLAIDLIPQAANPTLTGLLVTFNPTGLAPGFYTSGVNVTSTLGQNSPFVQFSMTVVPAVSIDANIPGLMATIDNVSYSLPQTFTWMPHSPHTIAIAATTQGDSTTHYVFDHWSSGAAASQNIAAPATAKDTTAWHAIFNKFWALQAASVPAADGLILLNPPPTGGFYADQTLVTVTAAPLTGFTLAGFSGDLTGLTNPQNLSMTGPRSISATFVQAPVQVTIASSATNLNVTVDGGSYTTPAVFTWQQGSKHNVAFQTLIAGTAGVQYSFQNWLDSPAPIARSITVGTSNTTYTAAFQTQYYLAASPSPASGGRVTGGGWYNSGASATLQATAMAGYQFTGFSGDATGLANPLTLTMDRAKTVAANFGPSGTPQIYAAPGGTNSDANGNRIVPIALKNAGQGAGVGAQIASVTNISVVSGSGQVTLVGAVNGLGQVTPGGGPFPVADLAPGASGTVNLAFQWPSTATRIKLTVNFSANGGAYSGSTVLNLFR